jgi:hypothetical protein
MQSIAVTTYDLEDQEISAAGFTVFTLGGRMESAGRRAEGAF